MKVAPEELELYDQFSSFMRVHVGLWSPILKKNFGLKNGLRFNFGSMTVEGILSQILSHFLSEKISLRIRPQCCWTNTNCLCCFRTSSFSPHSLTDRIPIGIMSPKWPYTISHEPRLNLLESLQLRHRHEDDDCPSAASAAARCTDVDLWTLKRDRV